MTDNALERFLAAISYPDRLDTGAVRLVLRVDEAEYDVEQLEKALRISLQLKTTEDELSQLAQYAPGRMYRDDAVLAASPDGEGFLWQDIPAAAGEDEQRHAFESFLDACDWWRERLAEMRQA